MQALKCEMCNSSDMIKQDGFYVCQSCGTKYTVEEAKKLMLEGTVNVEGTVKIDNSPFIEKYLANARRAKEKEDWKEAEKYYNMVEQNDPKNIEAIFYSTFAQVKSALVEAETSDKRQSVFDILKKGVSIIDDNFDNTSEEHKNLLPQIMDDIKGLKKGRIVPTTHLATYETRDNYGYGNVVDRSQVVENDPLSVTYNMVNGIIAAYLDSLANIVVQYSSEVAKELFVKNVSYLSVYSEVHDKVAPYIEGYKTPKQACAEIVKQVKIDEHTTSDDIDVQIRTLSKTICPMFEFPAIDDLILMVKQKLRELHPDSKALKSKGCYVATAVYGSYNCPEVWTLRRFRDNTLAETWYGRAFIRTYYAISPTLVKWFGNTEWFKKMWRGTLDRMVLKLQSKGFESTPYKDKEW